MIPLETLYDLARATLDALEDGWPYDASPLPERRYVSNGTIIWDGCEQVVVMVDATFSTEGEIENEGVFAQDAGLGFSLRAATFEVGVLRCIHDVDDDGNPPSPEEIESDGQIILSDAVAVFNVLNAAQRAGEIASCHGLAFERWSSAGPNGGLAGGSTRLRALLL